MLCKEFICKDIHVNTVSWRQIWPRRTLDFVQRNSFASLFTTPLIALSNWAGIPSFVANLSTSASMTPAGGLASSRTARGDVGRTVHGLRGESAAGRLLLLGSSATLSALLAALLAAFDHPLGVLDEVHGDMLVGWGWVMKRGCDVGGRATESLWILYNVVLPIVVR
jgi:hypothetical protein